MTKICIYYHMTKRSNDKTTETCIDLTMLDEIADDILDKQGDSEMVCKHSGYRNVYDVLHNLARIQGYDDAEFRTATAADN